MALVYCQGSSLVIDTGGTPARRLAVFDFLVGAWYDVAMQ